MKTRLFVDVDTQHDFCDPTGALFVDGAPAIMENVRRLIQGAVSRGDLLVGSVDSHNFTAWEFAANGGPFPPHCVKGTPGWLKMPGTLVERAVFVPDLLQTDHAAVVPEGATAVYFEKEVYSMFVNPEAEPLLDHLLSQRGLGRSDVEAVVFGIATDYCIKAAAEGLRERGYSVTVVSDAIAPVASDTGAAALERMVELGCRLQTTEGLQ